VTTSIQQSCVIPIDPACILTYPCQDCKTETIPGPIECKTYDCTPNPAPIPPPSPTPPKPPATPTEIWVYIVAIGAAAGFVVGGVSFVGYKCYVRLSPRSPGKKQTLV